MTAGITTEERRSTVPLRVLIAVHGYESPGWAEETCRLVSTWACPSVRVLAVLDVPTPPFTSLTGAARRAYGAARARWTEIERARLEGPIAALMLGLPAQAEVVRTPATRGDLARTIAEQARAWPADLTVVGSPARGLRSWLRTGPVHERLLRLASCAVLVTVPSRVELCGLRRLAPLSRTTPAVMGEHG
jgi:nucleotide-binding universal stress UspA family protein